MSNETFQSRSGEFSGTIPQGWFFSPDTTVAITLETWLLSDKLDAAIIVRELHLDNLTKQHVLEEGLEYLAELSKSFEATDSATTYQHQIEFTLNQTTYFSYEILSASASKRVVVFRANNHFFECEASPMNGNLDNDQQLKLFSVQQTVLASLKFSVSLP